MKAPSEAKRLASHREQALDYWRSSADVEKGIEAPPFVVICAFQKMEIWQPGKYPKQPRLALDLVDLPDQFEALQFLAGDQPIFKGGQYELTREAVRKVAGLYNSLVLRDAAEDEGIRNLMFQCVWCMFAEDVGMLPNQLFSRLVIDLLKDTSRSSSDELGRLFEYMNDSSGAPQHGIYAGTPYVNGGLFAKPARVHLLPDELEVLAEAAQGRWQDVEPSIFGGLLEGGMEHEQQWHLGAHYTHVTDIQKIVEPTIVRPWNERIAALKTYKDAVKAQSDLLSFVVLDPACGSGNFLYVAYRELRRISKRLADRIVELRKAEGLPDTLPSAGYYPLSNVKGIEIDGFAVSLARVTLWMGHKLSVDELGLAEKTIPLVNLAGIQQADALRIAWPEADVIIGNPPFHGSQMIRREYGDAYIEFLKREFDIGVKDYCVYWFRKAHDALRPGQRAGLVGTNSISQNRARSESLEYIVKNGGVITDAVSTQKWPGEAKVHVSIVNWVKEPSSAPAAFTLDGESVDGIGTSLTAGADSPFPVPLVGNKGRCFQGPIPVGAGFVLERDEAEAILSRNEAAYVEVIRPYLMGDDIVNRPGQQPSRYVIDFAYATLERAQDYPKALEIVVERVKPFRATVNREGHRKYWWRFGEPRRGLRSALDGLPRFIATSRHGKRVLFAWVSVGTIPSDATNAFAFADDYAMGVLMSHIHAGWVRAQSSTLKGDVRYTPTTAFATFAWPSSTDVQRETIADACRALYSRRSEICFDRQIGLTQLYNEVDDGAYEDLAKLHVRLDEAVAEAYGWPKSIAQLSDETNARLLDLNLKIAAGQVDYAPFAYLKQDETADVA